MFGGGKKKKSNAEGNPPTGQNSDLFDLSHLSGLVGLPGPDQGEDDSALEAELAALMADDGSTPHTSKQPPRQKVPLSQINQLAAEAMKSIEDEEVTEDDLENPDLLAELALLSQDDDTDTLRPSPQGSSRASPRPSPRSSPRPSPRSSPRPSPQPSPRSSPTPQRKSETNVQAVIEERIANYQLALKNAEAAGESSKVRRYGRGLKSLKDMDKKLKRGVKIDESEIPPVVAGGRPNPSTSAAPDPAPPPQQSEVVQPPASSSDTTSTNHLPKRDHSPVEDSQMMMLKQRQHEYKVAALEAKRAGNLQMAADHLRVAKQFDSVIQAVEQGDEVDLSGMPPPPSSTPQDELTRVPPPAKQLKIQAPAIDVSAPAGSSEAAPPPSSSSSSDPPAPRTTLEALQQRCDSYKALLDKATTEGNASKCRRLGRISKSYQDAIKKEKAGRPVDYEELPSLPGFHPIPPRGAAPKTPAQPSPGQTLPGQPVPGQQSPGQAPPGQRSSGQPSPGQPSPGQPSPGQPANQTTPKAAAATAGTKYPVLSRPPSAKEAQNLKNMRILVERQKQFKMLAIKAKKEGDMDEAMRFLKTVKGFDSMITASENGLPVNMDTIPDLPSQRQTEDFEVISPTDMPNIPAEVLADKGQLYARLITSLDKQIQICSTNEKQYLQLGNLSTSRRFGDMRQSCQQDLDLLTVARSHSDPVPRFHFESRTIPTIRVCPDLTDTEVEVTVVRGTQYKLPSGEKDLDTYVKYEFPYPSDEPQCEKTGWGKGFETVEYNDACKLQIQRNRTFSSCVKRRSVKFEVYYGRGFLRSDKLLAQASLKLAELESKCEIHESIPLLEGRKATGGKLEVKVRIHHPLSGVKEDQTKEKWLVINSAHKQRIPASNPSSLSPKQPSQQGASASTSPKKSVSQSDSLAVLSWESSQLKKKIAELQAQRRPVPNELVTQQKNSSEKIHKLQMFLKEGGRQAKQAYVSRLKASLPTYTAQAKQTLLAGNKDKAGVLMAKKKLVETEIASLSK